ncbi:aldehyde dehydrogenase family protein [Microbacterium sp. 22242]|uniref:aldehyde dehydrogenase family protein n=1 Tax=Microbacterium sp. 22242 TaxID=3453896 RepID=UPI003F825C1F
MWSSRSSRGTRRSCSLLAAWRSRSPRATPCFSAPASERAPRTAGGVLADALHHAGVPRDVVQLVTTRPGEGRDVIGALIESPHVRRVVFIGSTSIGRRIGAQAGAALTPAVLELGGKNVTIVRADADLAEWIPRLVFSAFANSGQVCMCTDRIIVHHSRADELTRGLAAAADALSVGDPREAEVDLGPVIGMDAALRFDELVADAVDYGARIEAGGRRDSLLVRPTVLTGVTERARFHAEEGFLPIVSIQPYDDDDEAVALANAGEYGLIASVVSRDRSSAERIAHDIRAGVVHINGPSVGDEPHVPFGGLGASGAGRLGGTDSVRFFTEQRTFFYHA